MKPDALLDVLGTAAGGLVCLVGAGGKKSTIYRLAAAFGGLAHRARMCPLRAPEGHQGNQGGACAGQDGSGSEHHHNFHVFRFRRCKEPGLVRVFHRSPGLGAGGGHRVTMQGKARNPTGSKRKIATNRAS